MSYDVLKKIIDYLIVIIGLIFFVPFLVLYSFVVFIFFEEKQVFFTQDRIGKNRQVFTIIKLKTIKKSTGEITKIGSFLRKTSIDEMPQFINVLKGEMSIVGPRPMPVEEDNYFRKLISNYDIRSNVLPGLTGLAQTNGNRGTMSLQGMRERVAFDISYVEDKSIYLDIKIIFLTIANLIYFNEAS